MIVSRFLIFENSTKLAGLCKKVMKHRRENWILEMRLESLCRPRKMLKDEPLVPKFRFDTAENESFQLEIWRPWRFRWNGRWSKFVPKQSCSAVPAVRRGAEVRCCLEETYTSALHRFWFRSALGLEENMSCSRYTVCSYRVATSWVAGKKC